MDFQLLSGMKVEELKAFLRLRGLKVSGRKEELIARAFVAIENNVPIVLTAEEVEIELAEQYTAKLNVFISDEVGMEEIPDPFKLTEGWISESEGVKLWPHTLYPDIFNFLAFHPNELASSDLCDYKTSKGYSYYQDGWLKPLDFNIISPKSSLCLLRTICRPSQRISDVPHKLWVCLMKTTGRIMAAHCSCMAGISQTCNHIAAALFRIEAAVRMGLSNPSCTSKPCEWLPNNKDVQPLKVTDLKLVRGDFGRRGKSKKMLNSSPKKKYDPTVNIQGSLNLNDIVSALRSVCNENDSIIFTAEQKEIAVNMEDKGPVNLLTPSDLFCSASTAEEFINTLFCLSDKISEIEKATRGQSSNDFWFSVRRHLITASKAHDVKTRMLTHKSKGEADFSSVFARVSGEKLVNARLPALKYGLAMEEDATAKFFENFAREHKSATLNECGLFLSKELPFIGGSPDRIVYCDCCGKSCLEVKCPFSIAHTSPTDPDAKLPYLAIDSGSNTLCLRRNHKYFTQCQVQMAATKSKQCYFFVWTSHGTFTEKVNFDQEFWDNTKDLLNEFYTNFYIPHVFSTKLS